MTKTPKAPDPNPTSKPLIDLAQLGTDPHAEGGLADQMAAAAALGRLTDAASSGAEKHFRADRLLARLIACNDRQY